MKANGGDRYVAVVSLGYRNHTAIQGTAVAAHPEGCRPANIQIDKKKSGRCRIPSELRSELVKLAKIIAARHVAYWHKADIPAGSVDVRFRG